MKRLIILSLLALLSVAQTSAQPGRYSYHRRHSTPVVRHPSPAVHHSGYSDTYYSRIANTDAYYGLRLGLNVATVHSDDRYLDGSSAKTGFNLGLVAGFQVAPSTPVYLETGLYYTEKGGKGNYNGPFTYELNYLQVPLLMKINFDLDPMTRVQPFVGVYGALGVSGKIKDFNQRQAYSSFGDDAFQRFDAGLRLGCGLQFSHLYAEVGYDIGLANIGHDYFDVSRTGCLFAGIGINF